MENRLKLCPVCHDIWLYVSDGDWCSNYEANGYRVNCQCGLAWRIVPYQKTKSEAIRLWNDYLTNRNTG